MKTLFTTLVAKLKQDDIKEALSIALERLKTVPNERVYPLAWLLYRGYSAIESVFSQQGIPEARIVAVLETFLAELALEARVLARRGVVVEDAAEAVTELLLSDELVSQLRACRRGSCKPREILAYAHLLKVLAEVLWLAGSEGGDCIPA